MKNFLLNLLVAFIIMCIISIVLTLFVIIWVNVIFGLKLLATEVLVLILICVILGMLD